MFYLQELKLFLARENHSKIVAEIKQRVIKFSPFVALVGVVVISFYQVIHFDFLNFDDPVYVVKNPFIFKGLSLTSIGWAFTSSYAGNWHPLTWIALMIQYQNVGANSACFHLFNAAFHLFSTLILFLIFKRASGSSMKGFLIAAFFAIHPMHVQSVAWVSEVKDVLSTFLGLLSLYFYQSWALKSDRIYYWRSIFFFTLSLLSKQTLVTFPIILILFDYWPLQRMQRGQIGALIREKIPYLILSAAAAMLTFWAQSKGGAVQTFEYFTIDVRLINSLSSYFEYIVKFFLPLHLSIYYPYVRDIPWSKTFFIALAIIAVTFLAIRLRRKQPYFLFGWLFYLITLLPVIGIVQIGSQALADRYTYIPYIGLFIIISFFTCDFFNKTKALKTVGIFILCVVVSLLTKLTFAEVGYWKNSITLFQRNADINPKNYLAHYQLGMALYDEGKIKEAKAHIQETINLLPTMVEVHNVMGLILMNEKKFSEAEAEFKKDLLVHSDNPEIYHNLGVLYIEMKEYDRSLESFKKAIKLNPSFEEAYSGILRYARKACNLESVSEFLPKIKELKNSNQQIQKLLNWFDSLGGNNLKETDDACEERTELEETLALLGEVNVLNKIPKVPKVFKPYKIY